MLLSKYRTLTTARGINYSYYYSPPTAGKPYLLFIHGFPNTANDWRYQVSFFEAEGYGLIVPDLLGYGGTDKPTDPALYVSSLICQDLVNILDKENAADVIAIGHDWGSKVTSRLANYYPARFRAFAFLAVSYIQPRPGVKFEDALAFTKQVAGYELLGYWLFFSEDNAHKLVEENIDSFLSLLLPEDPKLWITHIAPTGGLKSWLEEKRTTSFGSYLTEEEREEYKKVLLKNGFEGPLCWYKVMTSGLDAEDDKAVPQEHYALHQKPTFFGAATNDFVCLAAMGKLTTSQLCSNATVREFETGHWVMWEAKDEVNKELLSWIRGL